MSTMNNTSLNNWWAEGDTPVHADSRVTYLIDGRTTLYTMCLQFLKAHRYIYLANWGISPMMELVRGKDQRAGLDGSPAQDAFVAELRAASLDQDKRDFWCSHNLTAQTVLEYMVQQGVEVKPRQLIGEKNGQ